jgi:predicted RNA binding protein YcfA (HicA-like mRNA interferase family)
MKVRDVIKRLEGEGWRLARTKGSHRQYHHPDETGNGYRRGSSVSGHSTWNVEQYPLSRQG